MRKALRPRPLPRPADARECAFAVLDAYRASQTFVNRLLEDQLEASNLGPADRRLATELVYGIVRRQSTLDALIAPNVTRPRAQVEPRLWTILQIGAYQLAFLESIPAHAALNETVNLARWIGRAGATGFLNGVLRAVQRDLSDEQTSDPAANALPRSAGRYRRLAAERFADPATDPQAYIVRAFSVPRWLVRRWVERFGFEEAIRLADWFNTPLQLTLRVNRLKTDRESLLAQLQGAGIDAAPGAHPLSIHLHQPLRVSDLPGFADGHFSVQDEAAMAAAEVLDPQPGERVLDLCAAPGTKTAQLAELMNDTGSIVATDVNAERLRLVETGCRRLGIKIVTTALIGRDGAGLPNGPFDAILIDAPCSNTGVLGRRPDARWRIGTDDLAELSAIQQALLTRAAERLASDGRIVYSTCSIESEENRGVVDAFLEAHPQFRLVKEIEHIPGRPADGGYVALLRRE